jgi:hypothetical protein
MDNKQFELRVSKSVKRIQALSTRLENEGEDNAFMEYHKQYILGQLLMMEKAFEKDLRHIKKYGR